MRPSEIREMFLKLQTQGRPPKTEENILIKWITVVLYNPINSFGFISFYPDKAVFRPTRKSSKAAGV